MTGLDAMKNFSLWFLEELPSFLLSEPIIYFIGIGTFAVIVKIVKDFIQFH